jgi:hypothetical protein
MEVRRGRGISGRQNALTVGAVVAQAEDLVRLARKHGYENDGLSGSRERGMTTDPSNSLCRRANPRPHRWDTYSDYEAYCGYPALCMSAVLPPNGRPVPLSPLLSHQVEDGMGSGGGPKVVHVGEE